MQSSGLVHSALRAYFKSGLKGFYTLNRLLNAGYPTLTVKNKYGVIFTLSPSNFIDSTVLKEGYYESEVVEALKNFISPGAVFWDIGANFGLHGITLKKLYPELEVCLIEPLPAMCLRCQRHAKRNEIDVRILEAGLFDRNDLLPLYTDHSQSEGESSFLDHGRRKLTHRTTAQVFRGDEIIKSGKLPAPSLLKIDVEGAELNVLNGFGEYLENPTLRAIVFEAQNALLDASLEHMLAPLLIQKGFSIEKLPRNEHTRHSLSNFLAYR